MRHCLELSNISLYLQIGHPLSSIILRIWLQCDWQDARGQDGSIMESQRPVKIDIELIFRGYLLGSARCRNQKYLLHKSSSSSSSSSSSAAAAAAAAAASLKAHPSKMTVCQFRRDYIMGLNHCKRGTPISLVLPVYSQIGQWFASLFGPPMQEEKAHIRGGHGSFSLLLHSPICT